MRLAGQTRSSLVLACRLLVASLLAICALLCGCVYALRPSNQPSQERIRVQTATTQRYSIRVADRIDYPIPPNGRVIVDIPQLERGCATYLFGVAKVSDSSPEEVAVIVLKKDGRTIRKLSLNDLKKLPIDSQGYRLVKVE